MSRSSQNYLKPNPFTTYRDPETGRWVVVQENVTYLAQASAKRQELRPSSAMPAARVAAGGAFCMAQSID